MTRAQPEYFLKPKLLAVSVAACFALHAGPMRANPNGPSVTHGSVGFNGLGTSALTITNQAGGNAIINWNGFSIGINELTKFQQFANLAVLNRVTSGQISSILGSLQSDGRVFLINPNGIVFGASARIDVAGMVASSLNLSDQDFLTNRLRFTEVPGAGAVVNNGVIETATGGRVYLVAPTVENNGLIQAKQGEILLAAGKEVELVDGASPFVTVKVTAGSESALNVGNLIAEGGRIGMFGALVRNSGTVEAGGAMVGPGGEIRLVATKDLTLDAGSLVAANGTSGGKVLLQAEGGTNLVGGTVEAKGSAGKGGEVSALGVRVGVVGHGLIDASGETGGGTVLVGGDYQGKNAAVQNAERTYIGTDGVIRADAMKTGDGGRVIVWADGDTSFTGNISARGGAQAGDGGFAEVSGKQFLDYRGRVDLRAPAGDAGTLLLDPQDITIVYGIAAINPDITEVYGLPTTLTSNSAVNAVTTLTDGTINAQLALSNVVVQTGGTAAGSGDITFDSEGVDIFLAGNGSNLSFDATRNIVFTGGGRTNVSLNGGLLTLRAQSGFISSATTSDELALLHGLGSTSLLLIAGNGIGSDAVPLQTGNVRDIAAISSSNGIFIRNLAQSEVNVTSLNGSDLSGSTLVEGIRTNNAPIWLETIQFDGGGSIGLNMPINSGSARTTLLATMGQIYSYYGFGPSIVAGELVMSAFNGIGCGQCGDGETNAPNPLQTQVSSLQATNETRGVEIHNLGSLTLRDIEGVGYAINNPDGAAIISAEGSLTVANSITAGRRFSLVAGDHLTIAADVSGGPGGGEGSSSSELVADANADGVGSIVSAAGAGNVTTNGSSIFVTGQSVALGSINASNTGAVANGGNGSINILANSGISAGSLTTRSLAQQYGPGGSVLLDTVDGSIVVNGDIDTRGIGGWQGGSIGLSRSGTSLPAGGVAVSVNGSILASGGDGFGGGAGGTVFIGSMGGGRVQTELVATEQALVKGDAISISAPPVMGDVQVSGTIDASGGNGGSTAVPSASVYGGFGGLVAISSYGNVSAGPIFARGGRAGDGADGSIYGNFGGSGGGVTVLAAGAATLGKIDVAGGAGGNSAASANGSYGGSGGWGGGVRIFSLGEATINVGGTLGTTAIDASGGAGGSGNAAASPAGNGGAGGTGGSVEVIATPNMTLFGSVNTSGGAGGAGGAGDAVNLGGTGGVGGDGGFIYLDASTISNSQLGDGLIFVLAGTQFNVQAGAGGLGGAGGGAGGAAGTTLQTSFEQNLDYFGTIVILDPLSVPGINEGFQQVIEGSDDTTAFFGGEKEEEEEDKSQKELGSCKG